MTTKRGIILLLIVGLGILVFWEKAELWKPGNLLLTIIGIALYGSWKTRHYLSPDILETVCEEYISVILFTPFLLVIGGCLILENLKKGNDHSGIVISAIVFCFGVYLLWKDRQAFSMKNIIYTGFMGIAMIGFVLCMIGGIGFFTGNTGSKFSPPTPLPRWQAIKMFFSGLGIIGILPVEIWLPDIDSCVRKVLGKESLSIPWKPF